MAGCPFKGYTYLPETGEVFNPRGKQVGHMNKGRMVIKRRGKMYFRSRVAVYLMTGSWPEGEVDHEDRVKTNDRWVNLRDCARGGNAKNRGKYVTNRSGFKGVYTHRNKDSISYRAKIQVDNEPVYLGTYPSAEDAHAAYCLAAVKYHQEFHSTK